MSYAFRPFEERTIARPLDEPRAWEFDGNLSRREAVVDHDSQPPRVIRRVGWLRCLRCERPCFSDDVVRVRLCWCCGGLASEPVGPKLVTMLDIRQRTSEPRAPSRPARHQFRRLF